MRAPRQISVWPKSRSRRVAEIRRLAAEGPNALAPLCYAVRTDADLEVRITAAHLLGKMGDERALPALTETLASCFVRSSSRAHRAGGAAVAVAAVSVAVGACLFRGQLIPFFEANLLAQAGLLLPSLAALIAVPTYSRHQSRRRAFIRALGVAILQVTERTRSTRARAVVRPLRETAADFLQNDPRTRDLSLQIADRVDALIRDLETLPVAAAPPEPLCTRSTLPRPAQPQPVEAELLPRV